MMAEMGADKAAQTKDEETKEAPAAT